MTRYYVFNGDADGLCALQQLRLGEGRDGTLITGVKRDIELLGRVRAGEGDACTVLDISLDVNRAPLLALLAAGVSVRYFDHHHAGEVPEHPRLEAYLDQNPSACTSILVDRYLGGKARGWAIVGAFGDSLAKEAQALADAYGLEPAASATLEELGVALNYNAYGETVADLHVPPASLAEEMLPHADPLEFARHSKTYGVLAAGYRDDMDQTRKLEPTRRAPGSLLYVLPDAAWARRAIGTLANDLAKAHAESAVAILSPKKDGSYVASVRVPRDARVAADVFCRRYPSGGGRRTAAGVNHLPPADLERFAADFEAEFRPA